MRGGTTSESVAWDKMMRPPPPEAGDEAATDEHLHVHGQAAHHLARRIQRERRHEQTLAADKIAQLAVDGHDQRRRQDVGGGDPLHDLHTVKSPTMVGSAVEAMVSESEL